MTDLSGQYLGRYYLTERLGEGGMAVVYKAYDTRLERDVAIKIIRSGAFPPDSIAELLKRFEREAKSLAKLSHPNIVKVHDYGEHDESPYLVMEYLSGGTLKNVLGKPVPWQDAVRLILPVARGIAYAHQRGILHRDIKPANILITESGEPMLSDFGIAKLFEGDQTTALTGSGMAIGTPEYMAPEQWTGTTSPQSDLYSLGIVLYEMVTGRKPYVADTPAAILIKQATEPLPSVRKFSVDVPDALELMLIKALARAPEDRYNDMSAFISELGNLHAGVPVVAPPEPKPVEVTYQVPSSKREAFSSTEIVTQIGRETVQVEESQAVQESLPAKTRAVKVRPPIRFSRRGAGVLIGGVIVILAVWLGSPLIGKLFALRQISNATPVSTVASVGEAQTLEPNQTDRTPALDLTPTETVLPSTTPLPTEITDAKSITMRLVPVGEFTMGSTAEDALDECKKFRTNCQLDWFKYEEPPHQVYLDAFYMDIYEVTNAAYKACVDAGGCISPRATSSNTRSSYFGNSEFDDYPVIWVDWYQAKAYCEWRSASLPSESQWEKAARGTDGHIYPWGGGVDYTRANSSFNVGDTTKVGSYESGKSPYGMYDMAGNVWEWVADWFEAYPGKTVSGEDYGTQYRALRGGAWNSYGYYLRTSIRLKGNPDIPSGDVGFRCARSIP